MHHSKGRTFSPKTGATADLCSETDLIYLNIKQERLYIDSMLMDAGWTEGKDWMNEVELPGMPNKSEVGFADYVLYDDMHRPLAVIEAKRTCVDVVKGRQQAKLYADLLRSNSTREDRWYFLQMALRPELLIISIRKERCSVYLF